MTIRTFRIVGLDDVPSNTARGGDLRTILSPATVGATAGFMGVAIIEPGARINEHYHPYSEEFFFLVSGTVTVDLDGEPHELRAEQGVLIPKDVRHRIRNTGHTQARAVYQLCPLAPRPELGHVDTEVPR